MRHPRILLALLAASSPASPVCAVAQSAEDVIVMRRVVAPPKKAPAGTPTPSPSPTPTPTPTPPPVNGRYEWVVSAWIVNPACSATATQSRLVGCARDGVQAADEMCTEPKPDTTRTVADYSTCTYGWLVTGVGDWRNGCLADDVREVMSVCRRSDGSDVAESLCSEAGPKPAPERGLSDTTCTYSWSLGEFGDFDKGCDASAVRKRTVECVRSDGRPTSPIRCSGDAPASQEVAANYAQCTYDWAPSSWSAPSSGCSATATQSRSLSCQRGDAARSVVDASFCATSTPPATTRTVEEYSGCAHDWVAGEYGPWSSTCSANAARSRDVECRRSDGTKATSDSLCTGSKPGDRDSAAIYTGCTFSWSAGEWSSAPSCSASVTQTRSVTCKRSDGTVVDDAMCVAADRLPSTQVTADYSSCNYLWKTGPYSAYANACADGQTRTRRVYCERQDGAGSEVDDALCGDGKPSSTDVSSNYAGCAADFVPGGYSDWSSHCSANASRSQTVTCVQQQPAGPAPVSDTVCTALGKTKPPTVEYAAVYDQCVAGWDMTPFVANPANCSASAVDTRTVTCRRTLPDGSKTTELDSVCAAATPKPSLTQPAETPYAGCSYRWDQGGYGPWSSTCSATAYRDQTVQCMRLTSPETPVPDSFCTSALGTTPERRQTAQNVTDCGGTVQNGNFDTGTLTGWSVGATSGSTLPVIRSSTGSYAVRSGSFALGFPLSAGRTVYASQQILTKQGVTYSLTAWGNGVSSFRPVMSVTNSTGQVVSATLPIAVGVWTQFGLSFVGDGSPATIRIEVSGVNSSVPTVDDVLVTVTAPTP